MLLILLGVIAGIIIGIYNTYGSYYDCFMDYFMDYFMNIFIGTAFGAGISLFIAIAIPMETYKNEYSLDIESLQDNNSVSGNFFLGCGQIEGKMKYVFYYRENDLYRMMQLDYNLVQIKYSDSSAKVNVTENCPTEAFINKFSVDMDLYHKTYIIEVPKGTIKNNYNLDSK